MKEVYYSLISLLAIVLESCTSKEKTPEVFTNVPSSVVTEPVQSSTSGSDLSQTKRMDMTSTPDAFDIRRNSTRRKQLASKRTPSSNN